MWTTRGPLLVHDEGRLLDGVVADGNDEVGLVDRLMDPVALRQRRGAHIEIGAGVDRALPHLGVEEGNAETADELRQRLGELRTARGRAQHHQRALRRCDHAGGAVDRDRRRHRELDRMRAG